MARPTARRWILYATALALLVRLVHVLALASTPVPYWQQVGEETDMYATWAWAEQIRAGDWLGRAPYHPYTKWMQALGSKEDWAQWWGGTQKFQQAPLYAYAVAAVSRPPSGSALPLFWLQALLGAAGALGVAWLGACWGGPLAGILAAFLWALCRTEVAMDGALLRDALALPLVAGGLVSLLRVESSPRPWRWALGAGLLLGVGCLDRENVLLLALASVPLAGWLAQGAAPTEASPVRRSALAAVAAAVGVGLAFGPLAARNLAVGAPPLAFSNRGPEVIFEGLSPQPGADPVGLHIYPQMGVDLAAAHGSTLRALEIVLAQSARTPRHALALFGKKLWGWLSAGEPGDNVDLEYLELKSLVLRGCLPTALFIAPALLGLVLVWRRGRAGAVAAVAFLLLAAPMLLSSVVWRFRAGLLPLLVPLSAVAVAWTVRRLAAWRSLGLEDRRGTGAGVIAVALFTAMAFLRPASPLFMLRPLGTALSVSYDLRHGDPDAARGELEQYQRQVELGQAVPSGALSRLWRRLEDQR